ncbi:MAG: hypothetical protein R3C26_14115 [Calditrichia bacterium]
MQKNPLIIVEDNEAMRLGMTESLRRAGYDVFDFPDARTALDFFASRFPAHQRSENGGDERDGIAQTAQNQSPQTELIMVFCFGH